MFFFVFESAPALLEMYICICLVNTIVNNNSSIGVKQQSLTYSYADLLINVSFQCQMFFICISFH
jgi:hypothetical protein